MLVAPASAHPALPLHIHVSKPHSSYGIIQTPYDIASQRVLSPEESNAFFAAKYWFKPIGVYVDTKYAGDCQLALLHTLLDFHHLDIQKMSLLSPLAWVNWNNYLSLWLQSISCSRWVSKQRVGLVYQSLRLFELCNLNCSGWLGA